MLEIGKTYYFISHAYYHYLGRVTACHGVQRISLDEVSQIHSYSGSWSSWYAKGDIANSRYDSIASSPDFSYISAFVWDHPLPPRKTS